MLKLIVSILTASLLLAGCAGSSVGRHAEKDAVSGSTSQIPEATKAPHQKDAGNKSPVSPLKSDPEGVQKIAPQEFSFHADAGTVIQPDTDDADARFSDPGQKFTFDYPDDWSVQFTDENKVELKKNSPKSSDVAKITVAFMQPPEDGNFMKWFLDFPKGTDEYTYLGQQYSLIAYDAETIAERSFYKALPTIGALKLEYFYMPGQTGSIGDVDSKEQWKFDEEFRDETFADFFHVIKTAAQTE